MRAGLRRATLANALVEHFEAAPEAIAPEVSLVVVPALNPDGLVLGRTAEGRFNGAGVDLNRKESHVSAYDRIAQYRRLESRGWCSPFSTCIIWNCQPSWSAEK